MPAGASSTVRGSPISVLRFSRLATVRRRWAQHRREDVLGRRLAGRAGDPDHRAAQRAPPRGGQALQRGQRVVGGEDGPGLRAARRVGVLGRDEHPPRARRPAPAPRSARRRRARPRARRTGRRARPRASRSRRARARRRAAPAPRAARRRPARPAQATSRARSASRATATSSKGTLRPPSNSWPCSWPLPAMTTTSPGARQRDGALDRRAAVDHALTRPARPRRRRR